MDGKTSITDATTQRIRKLCAIHGLNFNLDESKIAAKLYNEAYIKNRQTAPGTKELLFSLKSKATIGLITNGLVEPQIEKLRVCQIAESLDFIVVSEAVGCMKPSKDIFELALKRANVKPSEAVYVGDSWESDIAPAVNLGMKAVWLNRYGAKNPNPLIAREVTTFKGAKVDLFLEW